MTAQAVLIDRAYGKNADYCRAEDDQKQILEDEQIEPFTAYEAMPARCREINRRHRESGLEHRAREIGL